MSESIINHIERAEKRDTEKVEKIAEYAGICVRYAYEIDNNDVCYRGIDIEDFEKACLASRIEILDELRKGRTADYEEVIKRFVTDLEFKLFDGLYMGDPEDLIEESEEKLVGEEAIC